MTHEPLDVSALSAGQLSDMIERYTKLRDQKLQEEQDPLNQAIAELKERTRPFDENQAQIKRMRLALGFNINHYKDCGFSLQHDEDDQFGIDTLSVSRGQTKLVDLYRASYEDDAWRVRLLIPDAVITVPDKQGGALMLPLFHLLCAYVEILRLSQGSSDA